MRRPAVLAALAPLVAIALLAAAPADPLQLPEGRTAVAVTKPYTRVTVRADGTIEHGGEALPRPVNDVILPRLVGPLEVFIARNPDGSLLLAGDRRVDFKAVREVLASANSARVHRLDLLTDEGNPPRAIRVEQSIAEGDPLLYDLVAPGLPPLTVHLTAEWLWVGRKVEQGIRLPHIRRALDLAALTGLLEEDKRLHPAEDLVILNTDDGVPYADTVAVLDLTREEGFPRTLLAGGPPSAAPHVEGEDAIGAPAAPPAAAAPATPPVPSAPAEVVLRLDGGFDARAADGTLEPFAAESVEGYEAHCDTATCDIVARGRGRRVLVGTRPRDVHVPGWLFAKPVTTVEGRVGLPSPRVTGTFSPIVGFPPAARPATLGAATRLPGNGAPIILGSLDKSLIDNVIKRNMSSVRQCYQDLLGRDPKASGKVTMKFIISAKGPVQTAVIKASDFVDEAFHDCMARTFKTLVFPEPKGGGIVIVSYPFIFSPG